MPPVAGIWGVHQQMEELSIPVSPSLSLSFNKYKFGGKCILRCLLTEKRRGTTSKFHFQRSTQREKQSRRKPRKLSKTPKMSSSGRRMSLMEKLRTEKGPWIWQFGSYCCSYWRKAPWSGMKEVCQNRLDQECKVKTRSDNIDSFQKSPCERIQRSLGGWERRCSWRQSVL